MCYTRCIICNSLIPVGNNHLVCDKCRDSENVLALKEIGDVK